MKLYLINEPEGTNFAFFVYGGTSDALAEHGHFLKVVLTLTHEFLGQGHSVLMDNFYNSFSLASKLPDSLWIAVDTKISETL